MGKIEIELPAMGEGIIEATITRWFVNEGEFIEENQPLLEVATDKVDSEIPSPISGKILKVFFKEGEIPKVGEVLVIIENENIQTEDTGKSSELSMQKKKEVAVHKETVKVDFTEKAIKPDFTSKLHDQNHKNIHISPFIRFLAKNREIEYEELLNIQGTGLDGRITKDDINKYIQTGRHFKHSGRIVSNNKNIEPEQVKISDGEELIEMDRTRKLIAAHMVNSKKTSPHVTSMIEIDITHVVLWRSRHKEDFYKIHGVNLTYTPLMVRAVTKALKEYPDINISVVGEKIIKKNYFNIGVATALPDGNLIVPVIKDADKRNFINLASTLADLADRARKGKLEPAEIKGGTFTITNLGLTDNISGTPIINQPEVAILAVGAIKRKPWVVITNGQESIGIRDIMVLSLTYDHRVIDGYLGGTFLKAIGNYFTSDLPDNYAI